MDIILRHLSTVFSICMESYYFNNILAFLLLFLLQIKIFATCWIKKLVIFKNAVILMPNIFKHLTGSMSLKVFDKSSVMLCITMFFKDPAESICHSINKLSFYKNAIIVIVKPANSMGLTVYVYLTMVLTSWVYFVFVRFFFIQFFIWVSTKNVKMLKMIINSLDF